MNSLAVRAFALTIALAASPALAADGAEETDRRADMRRMVTALTALLPLATDATALGERRADVTAHLDELAAATAVLAAHGTDDDPSFRFLSRDLASHGALLRDAHAAGRDDEVRFELARLTATCANCHSRLPAAPTSAFGKEAVAGLDLAKLPADERVRLQVATRQFEDALATYERLLADPKRSGAALDIDGHVTDYLTVALRTQWQTDRARRTLDVFAKRDDLPGYLRRYVEEWSRTLAALSAESDEPESLERARTLADRGVALRTHPASRAGVVFDIAASAMAYRMVDRATEASREVAGALYLLGRTDAWTRRRVWSSEARYYLETAITMAPDAPFAADALDLYEEYTVFAYSGSGGVALPEAERARIDNLRVLVFDSDE